MGVTVNWTPVQDTTGYTLYRSVGVKVDLASPPVDKIDVAADKTSYTYGTSVNNTVYYIVVGAKKADGTVTYSDQIQIGYYPDTGPGPTKLLRGDWTFGYFGEVSVSDLLSNQEIYSAVITATAGVNAIPPTDRVLTTYYKCIVNGRIIFIPDNVYTTSGYSPASMISSKLIMPTGDYENNGIVVAKNGYEFIARLPHATTGDVSVAIADISNIYATELGMMFSLFGAAAVLPSIPLMPGVVSVAKYRLNDLTANGWVNVPLTTTKSISAGRYAMGTLSTGSVTFESGNNGKPCVVLELLF